MIFRIPVPLLRARLGWLLADRVVLVEHVGRRTGHRRDTAVEVIARDNTTGAVTVASGHGARADWYRNLCKHPNAVMVRGARRIPVQARQISTERAAEIMVEYGSHHPSAAPRVACMLGYVVDGTPPDYASLGRALRLVELAPDPPSPGPEAGQSP